MGDDGYGELVKIPSIFVNEGDGDKLRNIALRNDLVDESDVKKNHLHLLVSFSGFFNKKDTPDVDIWLNFPSE